ncbi:putative membrane protein [Xanthomonas campestris pv. raphani 756C]|nr:putative membrane protein [Xanthomonas campestris pv. raphani 756C]
MSAHLRALLHGAPALACPHFNATRSTPMWYFAWILGTGLAALAAVLNGMWFEAREQDTPH